MKDKPGFPLWSALWAEIVCNIKGCDWTKGYKTRYSGDLPVQYPIKWCLRCRRGVDGH